MALASVIRSKINQLPKGRTFGYDDLCIAPKDYLAAAKAMERIQKAGIVKKVAKGVFYKPEQTVFGELLPDYNELLRPYLFENGKRVAYETGVSLYRRMGLTTQMAFIIKISSLHKRIKINRGSLKAEGVKSYADVTENNYEVLGLLDAVKDIKKIPDTTIALSIKRLQSIFKGLDKKQTEVLIKYALLYPSRVRALVGSMLQNIAYDSHALDKLKQSLNPLTTIRIGIAEDELPTKNNWYIK